MALGTLESVPSAIRFSPILTAALLLALTGPSALAARPKKMAPPPKPSTPAAPAASISAADADPAGRARSELKQALVEFKIGETDKALSRLRGIGNSASVPPALRGKSADFEAQILTKKRLLPEAQDARRRQVEHLDDKRRYHGTKNLDDLDLALKRDVEGGAEMPEATLKAYLQWGELARRNEDRDTALRAYRVPLAYDHEADRAEAGLIALKGMPVDSLRPHGGSGGSGGSESSGKGMQLLGFRIHVVAGLLMVTDTLTYTDVFENDSELPLNSTLILAGVMGVRKLGKTLDLTLTLGGLFGSVAGAESEGGELGYIPEGSAVGALVEPGIRYRLGKTLSFGLTLPVMVRSVSMPAPDEQDSFVTLPDFLAFGGGAALTWSPKRFVISPRAQFSPSYGLGFGLLVGYAL
ncbi:MAG: hypothetical protein IT285_02415 [Bdellovibrionales bacterium]|nr:hypothetical protein [Bdellovibrionales bacterium]